MKTSKNNFSFSSFAIFSRFSLTCALHVFRKYLCSSGGI